MQSGSVKGIHRNYSEQRISLTLYFHVSNTQKELLENILQAKNFRIIKTSGMNESCSQVGLKQQEELNLSDKLSTINTLSAPPFSILHCLNFL